MILAGPLETRELLEETMMGPVRLAFPPSCILTQPDLLSSPLTGTSMLLAISQAIHEQRIKFKKTVILAAFAEKSKGS
ncbi:hypothetical protein BT69DRAFT_1338229 [Atractiella rhizophila]|nr:hypothetical protein BT69DRAFT_1338229 [Atractiella rhizophila]